MKSTHRDTSQGGPGAFSLAPRVLCSGLLVGLVAGACTSGGPASFMDAAPRRDATVVDAPAVDGGGAPDAGAPRDAGATSCAWAACDPRRPGECPGGGACAFMGGQPVCVPSAGPAAEGEACERSLDCAAGLACFQRLGRGICARVCCPGDDAMCLGATRCVGTSLLVDGTATDWWHCVGPRPCDPLDPTAVCEPAEGCYIVSVTGDTDCRHAGSDAVGSPCENQSDCAPGLFCGGLTAQTCSRICSLGDSGAGSCPPAEGVCVAYSHSPPDTGLCTPDAAAASR